jgi:Kef-type K+ transport system membrane component KefB
MLFVDLAVILLAAKAFGALAVRLRQPAVIGELVAGLLLGPTLLGHGTTTVLFPSDVRPLLSALAGVGVAMFMFRAGLEVTSGLLAGERRVTISAALGSIVVPFGLGLGLALVVYHGREITDHRSATTVFLALALSVTAFPVLVRIIADRGLGGSRVGGIAVSAAALVDLLCRWQ